MLLASAQTFWAAMALGLVGYSLILAGLSKGHFRLKAWFITSVVWWTIVAAFASSVR